MLNTNQRIQAGKLKQTEFEPGIYLYIGSARNGLLGRIARHLRSKTKIFWHIDYFLQKARIEEIWVRNGYFDECQILSEVKNSIKNSCFPSKKFGSTDCRCPSHLIYLPENEANLNLLREKLSFEKVDIHGIQT
jgi:sugar fermentation stimulation protein A